MKIDLILKIAAVGILVAVINQVLTKTGRDEQAMLVTVAGLVVVLLVIVEEIAGLFNSIKVLFGL